MLYKDVKQGTQIYVFDRNELSVKRGVVESVSFPHLSANPNGGMMVVDVGINIDGVSKPYEIKDCSESAYVGTMMLTPNIDTLLNEIRVVKSQSEDALKMVEKHKANVEKCGILLTEFDPVYQKEKATDDRLTKIEMSIGKLTDMFEKMNTPNKII